MYSKAKVGGHPVHPMLVAYPIAFYTLTLIAFAIYQFANQDIFWFKLGYFCNYAGIVTAAVAAIPGFIDWAFGVPRGVAAKTRGLVHMSLNVSALLIFIVCAIMINGRWEDPPASVVGPILLSLVGVGLTMAAGYHGWEMIGTHKVGVSLTPEQERLEPVEKMDRESHEMPSRPHPI